VEKKEDMMNGSVSKDEEMEGARRATGISSSLTPHRSRGIAAVPDPEVPEKATRRRFTVEYKLRILREAQDCREQHQLGAMLRREGLYHSNLASWLWEQEKEILKLRSNLRKAELIIEAQKKMAELFQSYLDPKKGENS